MGKKRGHFQAFVEAEDGSVLRVIGPRAKRRAIVKTTSTREAMTAATARRERDEARAWRREAENLRGQLVVAVEMG